MKKESMEVVSLVVGQMAANCYLLIDTLTRETLIVDPGDAFEYIADKLQEFDCKPTMIVATHGHFDHIMAAFGLCQTFKIPFCIHKADIFLVERMSESAGHFLGITAVDPAPVIGQTLADKQHITVGGMEFIVVHTPGHTPGSICLYNKNSQIMFVGDTMFADGAVGRTDFSYSDAQKLTQSLQMLLAFPVETELLPGHGDKTTVGKEQRHHIQ